MYVIWPRFVVECSLYVCLIAKGGHRVKSWLMLHRQPFLLSAVVINVILVKDIFFSFFLPSWLVVVQSHS